MLFHGVGWGAEKGRRPTFSRKSVYWSTKYSEQMKWMPRVQNKLRQHPAGTLAEIVL